MQSLSNPVQEGLSLANPDNAKPVKPCPRRTKFGKPSFWCQSFTSGAGVMHCTFLAFGAKSVWSGHSQYQKVPFAHTKVENASSRRQPWPFNIERFLFHINNAENKPFNKTLNIKASFGLSNYQIELVQRYRRPPLSESAPESTVLEPGSPGPGPAQPIAVEEKFKISFKPLPINMTTSVVVKC